MQVVPQLGFGRLTEFIVLQDWIEKSVITELKLELVPLNIPVVW